MSRFGMSRSNPQTVAAETWPGLTVDTAKAFSAVGRGQAIDLNRFAVLDTNYYHRVAYATTGHTSLQFFNATPQPGVSNFNPPSVPQEKPMWLRSIRLTVQDVDTAGARIAAGASFGFHATAPTQYTRAEEIKTILQSGLVQLRIGDMLVADAFGLTRFPSGAGVNADVSGSSNSATTGAYLAASLTNGVPAVFNQYVLPYPIPVLPGQQVSFSINWQAALTTTTAGFTLMAELAGLSVVQRASR